MLSKSFFAWVPILLYSQIERATTHKINTRYPTNYRQKNMVPVCDDDKQFFTSPCGCDQGQCAAHDLTRLVVTSSPKCWPSDHYVMLSFILPLLKLCNFRMFFVWFFSWREPLRNLTGINLNDFYVIREVIVDVESSFLRVTFLISNSSMFWGTYFS